MKESSSDESKLASKGGFSCETFALINSGREKPGGRRLTNSLLCRYRLPRGIELPIVLPTQHTNTVPARPHETLHREKDDKKENFNYSVNDDDDVVVLCDDDLQVTPFSKSS
jgi:hypothetical protein